MYDTFAGILRARAGDAKRGLVFGDRQLHVGLLLENVPDYVHWTGAAGLSGAVLVGINSSRSASEIAQDVRHADVDLIITESRLRHLVDGQNAMPVHDIDTSAYRDLLAPYRGAPLPATSPAPEHLFALMFSSGGSRSAPRRPTPTCAVSASGSGAR